MKKVLVIKNKYLPLYPEARQFPTDRTGFRLKQTVMATLKYTTREINGNYKIKVSGLYEGKKINTLVGVAGLVRIVADLELTNRLLDRAFGSMEDKCVCKLRRGIKISFYAA